MSEAELARRRAPSPHQEEPTSGPSRPGATPARGAGAADRHARQRIDVARRDTAALRVALVGVRAALEPGAPHDDRQRRMLARRAGFKLEDAQRALAEARRYLAMAPEIQAEYDEVAAALAPVAAECLELKAQALAPVDRRATRAAATTDAPAAYEEADRGTLDPDADVSAETPVDRRATRAAATTDAPAAYEEADRGTLDPDADVSAETPVDRSATRAAATTDAPAAYDEMDRGTIDLDAAPERVASVQRKESGAATGGDPLAIAATGVAGSGSPLPYVDQIQASFGAHDVTHVQSHVGGAAAAASAALGAEAYATGDHVAFAGAPSLHTAAHEAAHVVQQRAGVQLEGGMGEAGDPYEQQADAVADAVVRGESAEGLFVTSERETGTASAARGLQLREDEYDHGRHVRLSLLAAAATAEQVLEAGEGSSKRAVLDAGGMAVARHFAHVIQALDHRSRPAEFQGEAELAVGHALAILGRVGKRRRAGARALGEATRELLSALDRVGFVLGDANAVIEDADASVVDVTDDEMNELALGALASARDRARTLLSKQSVEDAAERRALSLTAAALAHDVDFAVSTLERGTTPKQRLDFTDEIEATSSSISRLEQWARVLNLSFDESWGHLHRAEARMRRSVGLDPIERSLWERGNEKQIASQLVATATTGAKACEGDFARKSDAINAIKDKIAGLYRQQLRGLENARASLSEPPPIKEKAIGDEVLDVAVSLVVSSVAGAVASALSRRLAHAMSDVTYANQDVDAVNQKLGTLGLSNDETGVVVDAAKDGIKEGFRLAAKSAMATLPSAGPVSARSLHTHYLDRMKRAILAAGIVGLDSFELQRERLEQLDVGTLNGINKELCSEQLQEGARIAQEETTLIEWINFVARIQHGALPDSDQAAAIRGGEEHGKEGLLQVYIGLNPDQPRGTPVLHDLILRGIEHNVMELLRSPAPALDAQDGKASNGKTQTKYTLGELRVNKVFYVSIDGYAFSPVARVVQYPDSGRVAATTNNGDERDGLRVLEFYRRGEAADAATLRAIADGRAPFDDEITSAHVQASAAKVVASADGFSLSDLKESP